MAHECLIIIVIIGKMIFHFYNEMLFAPVHLLSSHGIPKINYFHFFFLSYFLYLLHILFSYLLHILFSLFSSFLIFISSSYLIFFIFFISYFLYFLHILFSLSSSYLSFFIFFLKSFTSRSGFPLLKDGNTALHIAVLRSNVTLADTLLQLGANIGTFLPVREKREGGEVGGGGGGGWNR